MAASVGLKIRCKSSLHKAGEQVQNSFLSRRARRISVRALQVHNNMRIEHSQQYRENIMTGQKAGRECRRLNRSPIEGAGYDRIDNMPMHGGISRAICLALIISDAERVPNSFSKKLGRMGPSERLWWPGRSPETHRTASTCSSGEGITPAGATKLHQIQQAFGGVATGHPSRVSKRMNSGHGARASFVPLIMAHEQPHVLISSPEAGTSGLG